MKKEHSNTFSLKEQDIQLMVYYRKPALEQSALAFQTGVVAGKQICTEYEGTDRMACCVEQGGTIVLKQDGSNECQFSDSGSWDMD